MLARLVLALFVGFFMMSAVASDDEKLNETVFELERSVAILQLSKANLEDYKVMNEKMRSLESRADFFAVLTFILCVVLVVLSVQVRKMHKGLQSCEQSQKEQVVAKE